MLRARTHRWARGERHAFDEEPVPLPGEPAELDTELQSRCEPETSDRRFVHVDLGGNVFVDADGTSVVLDVAPGWRTTMYANAVVVADALLWSGADTEIIDLLGPPETASPQLARALRFRLATEYVEPRPSSFDHRRALAAYRRVLELMSNRNQ